MKKNDMLTAIGLLLGAGMMFYGMVSGGWSEMHLFWDAPSVAITVGGSLAAVMIVTPMSEFKFNEVDSLILSQICYLNLEDFIPSIMDHSEDVSLISFLNDEKNILALCDETLDEKDNKKLLRVLANTTRYEGLKMNYLLDKFHIDTVEQFYSMCFIFEKFIFVAFRGTDTTLLGWKEDFNMVLMDVIPSQVDATDYLNKIGINNCKIREKIKMN